MNIIIFLRVKQKSNLITLPNHLSLPKFRSIPLRYRQTNIANFGGEVVVLIVWGLDLQVPVQAVPISTEAVSSYPANDEVYLMQHYAIKFV